MKKEKGHWAAGRVGDIDFVGSNKTRGKVRGKEGDEGGPNALLNRLADISVTSFSHSQFLRVPCNIDPVLIYQMLTEEWGLAPPHLVVALVGGDELAQMKPWLRDTLRKGLVKAAQSTGRKQWALASRPTAFGALCWRPAVLPENCGSARGRTPSSFGVCGRKQVIYDTLVCF